MKIILSLLVFLGTVVFGEFPTLPALAIALWFLFAYELFFRSSHRLAFREFLLALYGLNYLLAPAITYTFPDHLVSYKMKMPRDEYFELAIPAMLCLRIGLFAIKTKIFDVPYEAVRLQAHINQRVLKGWVIAGIILSFVFRYAPTELGFFVYLLSLIRFVAAFALFSLDRKKYRWWVLGVLFFEISKSIMGGMFHDMAMWLIFFCIFWVYLAKFKLWVKVSLASIAVFSFFVLQLSKSEYRQKTWFGNEEAGLEVFQEVVSKNIAAERGLFSQANIASSLTRVNQAWILASTVNHMERTRDFQGMNLMSRYIEGALLPRFLAPNKITSGSKDIFNRFSGHRIGSNTSMGLGIFADGYIAYGYWGALLFGLGLGLLFAVVFKIVERWAEISPFFILFILPILNYAVRPDCETQTTIGHLVKSVVLYGLLVVTYKKYFTKEVSFERKERTIPRFKTVP